MGDTDLANLRKKHLLNGLGGGGGGGEEEEEGEDED